MSEKKVVLITGCSDGGLGSELALAYHKTGKFRVIATARNLNKLTATRAAGIEELQLDVLSQESISNCVEKLSALTGGRLDVLVNNAGAGYNMPVLDIDFDEARKVFDLNVWSPIMVSRAFIPLLMKGGPKDAQIVNNISVVAYSNLPVQGVYNASKAAANSLTENLRLELKPFGIKVIALITGAVQTNFFSASNFVEEASSSLPADSIYQVVPNGLSALKDPGSLFMGGAMTADKWAHDVVSDLTKSSPPIQIWRGTDAWKVRLGTLAPQGTFDSVLMQRSKFDEVDRALKNAR